MVSFPVFFLFLPGKPFKRGNLVVKHLYHIVFFRFPDKFGALFDNCVGHIVGHEKPGFSLLPFKIHNLLKSVVYLGNQLQIVLYVPPCAESILGKHDGKLGLETRRRTKNLFVQ